MTKTIRRDVVVQLSRAEAPKWWGRAWGEILTAVESGEIPGAIAQMAKDYPTTKAPEDVAWLREESGRGFLLSQGW